MTDPGFESVVDRQIRLAQERGDFDDLPGMGKPLPGWGTQDDDLWWVRDFVRREKISGGVGLPLSIRLAAEVERLPERLDRLASEQAVREAVADLNRRIAKYLRAPEGPHVPVRQVDVDQAVTDWRNSRAA